MTARLLAAPALAIVFLLAACGAPPAPDASPAAPEDPGAAPLTAPEDDADVPTLPPAPTLGSAPGAAATLSAELAATVAASLPAAPTPDPSGEQVPMGPSFEGASAMALPTAPDEPERYVTHTVGRRGYEPRVDHQVVVWEADGQGGWRELAGATLTDIDYLAAADPAVGSPAPGVTWLAFEGGVGAHGGCFALLTWDGDGLDETLSHCAESPGAGELADLDGDGGAEVVLTLTDHYVFCYACGMRHYAFAAKAWSAEGLVDVAMAAPEGAPDGLVEAARLAQAGLWLQARAALDAEPAALEGDAARAAALIRRHADAYAAQAAEGIYPVLSSAFLGDYDAALEPFRDVPMADALGADGPLVAGTAAEGWESSLAEWMERATSAALDAEPDLAGAWFLRGWAAQLVDPASPAAREHVGRAATLDPGEPLYAAAVEALAAR